MIAGRLTALRCGLVAALVVVAGGGISAQPAAGRPAAGQPPGGSRPDQQPGHVHPPDGKPKEGDRNADPEADAKPDPAETPVDGPRTPLPALTDADRAAAFPEVHDDHDRHGQSLNSLVLFEQLEWRNAEADHVAWDTKAWVGGDIDRLWVRTEGDAEDGGVQEAQVHVLYGRAIGRWWDLVAGVRQDWRPGPAQTWAAVGIQGLAPYLFDVEATAYIGGGGRAHMRIETSYDLLITNRLIAQPLFEFELAAKADPRRRVGAGLTVGEASVRLRYEFRREFAPYIGVLWRRTFFATADFARLDRRSIGGTSLTFGGRIFF